MDFLSVHNITQRKGEAFVLAPITFDLQRGTKLAVAGATGSGKSTLLRIIAGLQQPDSGKVYFKGKKVWGPDDTLIPGHPGIGYLSQHFELRNNYSVAEELEYANQLPPEEAAAIYDVCHISHLLARRTHQLSGGERQRIVTARLLTSAPSLLLLDEPYSNLDVEHKNTMKAMIRDIAGKLGVTCVLVSHDPQDTLSWADELMVLQEGRLLQRGTPQQVYHRPVNPYTAGLFGKYQLLDKPVIDLMDITGPEDKKLMVRPEYWGLAAQEDQGLTGTIVQLDFYGNHYEAAVRVKDTLVNIHLNRHDVKEGHEVRLMLTHTAPCWL